MDMVRKMKGKQISLPLCVAIGIAVALVLSIAMAAMAAYLISTEKLQVDTIPICTAIAQLISAFAGTWIACIINKEKRLLTGGITALGYILLLLASTAILLEGQYSGILIGIAVTLVGSGAAVLSGLRKGRVRSRKHKIPAYR